MDEIRELNRQLFILSARRMIRPSIQDSEKMREIMNALYEKTGDELYKV